MLPSISGYISGQYAMELPVRDADVSPDTSVRPEGVVLQLGVQNSSKGIYGPDGRAADKIGERLDKQIQASKLNAKEQNEPCQTCAERKYQDGSNDMGVSFKAATNISPEAAGALVRAHEQEHVSNAQSEAAEKNMNVQSSVTIHTDICPECKRVYVSGGTTYTQMSPKPAKLSEEHSSLIGMLRNA